MVPSWSMIGGQRSLLTPCPSSTSSITPTLVFINDIAEGIESIPHLFADDKNLLHPTKYIQAGITIVNNDLIKVNNWCKQWCVIMNVTKIWAILYSRKRTPSLINGLLYNNTPIKIVTTVKHLGIIFDSKLCWNDHIDLVIEKARNAAYHISK